MKKAKKVAEYLISVEKLKHKENQDKFNEKVEIIQNRLGSRTEVVKTGDYYSVHKDEYVGNDLYFTKWLGQLEGVLDIYNGQ